MTETKERCRTFAGQDRRGVYLVSVVTAVFSEFIFRGRLASSRRWSRCRAISPWCCCCMHFSGGDKSSWVFVSSTRGTRL